MSALTKIINKVNPKHNIGITVGIVLIIVFAYLDIMVLIIKKG